jgi:hypothetical protein
MPSQRPITPSTDQIESTFPDWVPREVRDYLSKSAFTSTPKSLDDKIARERNHLNDSKVSSEDRQNAAHRVKKFLELRTCTWNDRFSKFVYALGHDPLMKEVYTVLLGSLSEREIAKLINQAVAAHDDYGRHREKRTLWIDRTREMREMAVSLAELLQLAYREERFRLPPRFENLPDLLLQLAREITLDPHLSFTAKAAISSRKRTAKQAYMRAFIAGLEKAKLPTTKTGLRNAIAPQAIATITTIYLDNDEDVDAREVRAIINPPKH